MNDIPRTIKIGGHTLQAPILFASYRMGDYPTSGLKRLPWSMTRTEALLINAYDFTRRKYNYWLNNGWDPGSYLKFNNRPIIIDSGAYYFRKNESISVTPESILDIELRSQAQIGVVLDHPFPPNAPDKARRISTTIHNTELMLKHIRGKVTPMTLMPVIHGHNFKTIRNCVERLRRLAESYDFPLMDHVGIGSLAPLAQRGHASLAMDVIHHVRRELPKSQIHCFSMGSGLLMLLAFYSGADSVDSQSWIVSAGFKLAQLPGHYVVRMGKREYKTESKFKESMQRFRDRVAKLANEENYSAKDWTTGEGLDLTNAAIRRAYVSGLVDLESNEHVHNRACHNLWTFNFEVRAYRDAIQRGTVDEFVASRLKGTRYESAFLHAMTLRNARALPLFPGMGPACSVKNVRLGLRRIRAVKK